MAPIRLHPLTLRFSAPYVERVFRADYERRSRVLVRASLALGLIQYAGFGLLDPYVAPVAFHEVRLVRGAVCVLIALALAATYSRTWRRRLHPAEFVAVAGGLGVVAMEWFVQHASHLQGVSTAPIGGLLILDGYYYSGLMLLLIYVHVLLRLRFVTASLIGYGLIGAYLAVAALHTPALRLGNAALFLLSTQLSGMVASYALERYARLGFLHARGQARTNAALSEALNELGAAQAQVARQERLASLGRVTAGVAHEIKNPLNFVNNFAALSVELTDEVEEVLAAADGKPAAAVRAELAETLADLRANARKIAEHGARADGIVRGMLQHARPDRTERREVDLNALVREHVEQAFDEAQHDGLACDVSFRLDPAAGTVECAPPEVGRVLTNLVRNACYALHGRTAGGGGASPLVRVSTQRRDGRVEVRVEDNGPGVPAELRDRVFEPFYTTKPPGEGTGLGLSVAHDIVVEGHGGTLDLEEAPGGGAAFVLTLPAPAAAPVAALAA